MKQLIKTFLFRVCLGAQLIFTKSQEFKISKGLNLIEGEVISIKKLKKNTKFKIPHIGWKKIIHYKEENKKDILLNGLNKKDYFYFVHSYVVKPKKILFYVKLLIKIYVYQQSSKKIYMDVNFILKKVENQD